MGLSTPSGLWEEKDKFPERGGPELNKQGRVLETEDGSE